VNTKYCPLAPLLISLVVCPLALFGVLFEANFLYVRIISIGLLVLGIPWLLSLLIMMAVSRARGQAHWLAKQLVTLAWTAQIAFYLLLSIRIGDALAERDIQVLRAYLEKEAGALKPGLAVPDERFEPLAAYRALCATYQVTVNVGDHATVAYHDPRTAITRFTLDTATKRWHPDGASAQP
jgi:hypothetical protein